ncbi:MAG: hypothetical protein AAGA48_28400 [Myxococcota bacterium]
MAKELQGDEQQAHPPETGASPTFTPNAQDLYGNDFIQHVLQSDEPLLDGQPVGVVGNFLLDRVQTHRAALPSFVQRAEWFKEREQAWAEGLGPLHQFVELFNATPRPDPSRWDVVLATYTNTDGQLQQVLGIGIGPDTLQELGASSHDAIAAFEAALADAMETSDAFLHYMQDFTGTAHVTYSVARDVSLALAVSMAVIVAAPVVFSGASAVSASAVAAANTNLGLGLTATGLASAELAGATLGTGLTMGVMGGAMESSAYGAIEVVNQMTTHGITIGELVDRVDWQRVGEEGWVGFQKGFVDGVLAYIGLGMENVLTSGAKAVVGNMLSEASRSLLVQVLRLGLVRAAAGGATGAVLGAIDGGLKATIEGRSWQEIQQAVSAGFLIGGALGFAAGGMTGVLEGRSVSKALSATDELRLLLASDLRKFQFAFREHLERIPPNLRDQFTNEFRELAESLNLDELLTASNWLSGNHPGVQSRDFLERNTGETIEKYQTRMLFAIDDMIAEHLEPAYEAAGKEFRGIKWNRETGGNTRFDEKGLEIVFTRSRSLNRLTPAEEIQHALDYLLGARAQEVAQRGIQELREVAPRIELDLAQQNGGNVTDEMLEDFWHEAIGYNGSKTARPLVDGNLTDAGSEWVNKWWHRRVFSRLMQNIAENRYGLGYLAEELSEVHDFYREILKGTMPLDEILVSNFAGIY